MEILTGHTVSSGIVIAEAVLLDAEDYRIPYRTIDPSQVDDELSKLETARSLSVEELLTIKDQVATHQGQDAADVFSWHIGVISDASVISAVEGLIRGKSYSASYATSAVMR